MTPNLMHEWPALPTSEHVRRARDFTPQPMPAWDDARFERWADNLAVMQRAEQLERERRQPEVDAFWHRAFAGWGNPWEKEG